MNHKTIHKKLLRYLDGDLPQAEKERVQRHLESCRTCREDLKAVESMWATEQPIERQAAPLFLWTRIAARLQADSQQGSFNKLVQLALRPVITVVVLFFIFFSGIKLGNLITGSSGDVSESSTERLTDNFGMSYFEISPPGSIDAHILALTESVMQE